MPSTASAGVAGSGFTSAQRASVKASSRAIVEQRDPQDVELQESILSHFARLPVVALRQLRVEVRDRVVTLLGQVANDYERQLAHHYVRRVPGVAALVDNLAVDEPPPAELGPIGRLQARFASFWRACAKWLPSTSEQNGEPNSRRFRDAGRQANRRSRLTHPLTFTAVALGLVIIAVGAVVSRADATSLDARLATYPVKGSVVVGKEPPKGAFVVFHPISSSPNAPRPAGYVTKFGGYSLTTYELGDGAPPGDYRVTIEWRQAGGQRAKALSDQLASPKTTTLRAHVTNGGNVVAQFRL